MIAAFMVPPAPEKKPKYVEIDAEINAVFDAGARSGDVFDALESIPAADVRPVVLCRDCVHRYIRDWPSCQGRRGDFFCADGKKREES